LNDISSLEMGRQPRPSLLMMFGPGLAMAAAGVGAGDVTMASLGGARFGLALVWAPLVAAVLKFALNEGLARYQLATGETLLEGWGRRLGPIASIGFLIYLVIWTIPVFAALASTSGVAMDLLVPIGGLHPALSGTLFAGGPDRADVAWSMMLVAACFMLIWWGRYALFERVMATMTVVMFGVVLVSGLALFPMDRWQMQWSAGPWWPADADGILLAIMGGTGSTVGVMAYSYWMRERGRQGPSWLVITRMDLGLCYLLSGLFGVSIMLLAGGVSTEEFNRLAGIPEGAIKVQPRIPQVFEVVAHRLQTELPIDPALGTVLSNLFKGALTATVLSSLLGMMQSIPYLYSDLLGILAKWSDEDRPDAADPRGRMYRSFLILLTLLPIPMVLLKTPTFILMVYAIWGSLFIPFLAATLLVLNNRVEWVGKLRNRWGSNIVLVIALGVFGWALISGVWEWIATGKPPLPSG
jgi:Mn2+/Fe2+ NRAMP family transporter